MLIYQIIHIESGHKYVGQTTRPAIKRWREHLYPLRKGKHHNRYLQAAWNKYGERAFKFEVIRECESLDQLNSTEIELIRNGNDLFNLADGGNAFKHDIETKKTIGASNKKPIVGMNIKTGKIKEYASAADSRIDGFDPACVRKCVLRTVSRRKDRAAFESISHRGWVWISMDGFSVEKLEELRIMATRSKIRAERPVIGMNVFTKEIRSFRSSSEAGRNGFITTNVHRACNTFSSVHKGFVWSYDDIDNPQSLLEQKRAYIISKARTGPKSWPSKDV